jgi:hypothetical protein
MSRIRATHSGGIDANVRSQSSWSEKGTVALQARRLNCERSSPIEDSRAAARAKRELRQVSERAHVSKGSLGGPLSRVYAHVARR